MYFMRSTYVLLHAHAMASLLACMQAHQFYYLGLNTAMFRIVQAKGSFTNVTLLLMFVMIYTEGSRISHIVLY